MGVGWLTKQVGGRVREEGMRAGVNELQKRLAFAYYHRQRPTYIWEREWDLCIVLDACRSDTLAAVSGEFDFLPASPATIWSPANETPVWMQETFQNRFSDALRRTWYVVGNGYSAEYASDEAFAGLDEVWRYAWNHERKVMPARPITDRAITAAREESPARMLVHYMQPHFPSVPDPLGFSITEPAPVGDTDAPWIWDHGKPDHLSASRIRDAYRENLRYVLDEVALLLENVDAETAIITADHGNAFGEWGIWGHPDGPPIPALRRVPWVSVTARDRRTHEPAAYDSDQQTTSLDEHLAALGYR